MKSVVRGWWDMAGKPLTDIRPSPIAGQWYPGRSDTLAATADSYMDKASETKIPGEIVGLVVPHAGYPYSGPIAAHAFRLVRGATYERVVVISPMHAFFPAPLLTTGHEAYGTPLGTIPVDRDTLDRLNQTIGLTPVRHDTEHSLEIELPFLQRALGQPFELLPLMLRDQSYGGAEALGRAVAAVVQDGRKTLLVASSDLSHFYTETQAHRLDRAMLDRVEAFDPEGVIRLDDEGKAFACGRAAIATVLVAARELGANGVKVVGYGTSGDATGDHSQVVGYGAAAIFKSR